LARKYDELGAAAARGQLSKPLEDGSMSYDLVHKAKHGLWQLEVDLRVKRWVDSKAQEELAISGIKVSRVLQIQYH
jgi:hypothetical protein